MHRLSPTPFSSDEGAESGEDSEEDLVTSYLGGGGNAADPPRDGSAHSHGRLQQLPLHPHQGVHPAHTHGQPRRLVRMAEIPTMDSITAESLGMGSGAGASDAYINPIPTISITPHSPISPKPFATLDQSLRQLHLLREKVQKMRENCLGVKSSRGVTRLSSSCPSLNVDGEEMEEEDPSSWSEEFLLDARKVPRCTSPIDHSRRKSWSGLSDEEKKRAHNRSVSLSSLDSDTEEPFFDAEEGANAQGSDSLDGAARRSSDKHRSLSGSSSPVAYPTRVTVGGLSTHSLNEAHLDEKKVKGPAEKPRLLTPRLTLQKSISTPSILAGVTNQQNQKQGPSSHLDSGTSRSPKYEGGLYPAPDYQAGSYASEFAALPHHALMTYNVLPKKLLSYHYDEGNSSSKRPKRSSIFFRKKKQEKWKKSSHHFVAVCYSNSRTCDVCSKPMINKPALCCETCLVCVHENTCSDQILDCSKLKNPKAMQKSPAFCYSTGLSNAAKSASLGSTPSASTFAPSGSRGQSNTHSRNRPPSIYGPLSSPARPHCSSAPSGSASSPVRRLSGFSQWRRVATKLGVNKITSEERELAENPHDVPESNVLETTNSASMESLDDVTETPTESTLENIDSDPELRLLEIEPELWVNTVDKEVVSQLSEKQVKKQEHIYELIITEKHHCRMLKILKELFAEGMRQELSLKETQIKSIFPCLDELITIHFSFLWRLRERQRIKKYIATIGDLLLEQFVGDNAQGLKDAYGLFCSRHQDAVSNYKEMLKTDRRFQTFIRSKSGHHLMKKKGIPECILSVSHRVTKYPLMIEAIMKYSKDQVEETDTLKRALECVKEILVNINFQVAEKERGQRLLEIYHKIDAKSSTMYRDQKFKKSDLFTDSRKLMFEGQAILSQQRGKQLMVTVIVMSDLIFFVQENNQKYYFVSPDSKAGAIPLGKLLVREKAGQDTRSIYLISGNQNEMFEFECVHPKDKKTWLDSIREAVEKCPDDDLLTGLKKLGETNSERLHELLVGMQHQDKELAKVCEDKMKMVRELVSSLGGNVTSLPSPDYRLLLEENNLDHESAKELQISSLNEALRLLSSASGWATNLSRSVSSVGEHQSEAYVSPSLPKRAETFGGFDNPNKDGSLHLSKQPAGKKKKDSKCSLLSADPSSSTEAMDNLKNRRASGSTLTVRSSQDNLSIGSTQTTESGSVSPQQQQTLAAHLFHNLSTALVLSQHHLSQYEMLRTKLVTGTTVDSRFSHSQKLEELRNIQEHISHERAQWTRERDHQEKWISDKKEELKRLQESLNKQQEDISQQREDLYRKLEALNSQGIVLNPCLTVLTSSHPSHLNTYDPSNPYNESPGGLGGSAQSPRTSPTSVSLNRSTARPDVKIRSSAVSIKRDSNPTAGPPHLASAVNQPKGSVPVKQQLPMKLAKLGAAGSSGSNSSTSTSSMSSSLGGSMSPSSQDFKELFPRAHCTPPHASPPSTVQQILPLKLSEGPSDARIATGRFSTSYHRLSSPSYTPSEQHQENAPLHQRTGSSPASLQNGAPSLSTLPSGGIGAPVAGGKATRTHTYPKLSSRPNPSADRMTPEVGSGTYASTPGRAGQPGQRLKDPDTDQDIIFF